MKVNALSGEGVFKLLISSPEGISEAEAGSRLQEYGLNEIEELRRTPLYLRFFSQFTHFLAVLLWIAAALSLFSEYLHPGEGMLTLGLAIIAVIFINAIFTFIQEYHTEKALEALQNLLPFNVTVIRKGTRRQIPAREVVPGDLIVLSEGDKVPADARVIQSNRLTVNNAPLTGESDAKPRSPDPFDGEYLESPNIVFAGTLVVSGSGTAVAFATGMSTEFGKIAHLTGAVEPGLSPLQREIKRVTRIVAVMAISMGILFFAVGLIMGRGFWHNFLFAIGIIIANVPEGLLPTVTLSLTMGSQRMAKKKALIKTLNSVETLGSVTVICTDKTGTLTQNRMAVTEIWLPGTGITEAAGENRGGADEGARREIGMLMKVACLCSNASFRDGQCFGDPTETALLKKAVEVLGPLESDRIREIPFDGERKRMSTLNVIEGRRVLLMKGAMETVLPLCSRIFKDNAYDAITDGVKNSLLDAYHALMDKGLRVIACAFRDGDPLEKEDLPDDAYEKDLVFSGLIGLQDPPRPEVGDAIRKCREAGIRVIMITGDASRTAVAIARQVGLVTAEPVLVEGPAMNVMSDHELMEKLSSREIVFARMTPRHKMRIVSILEDEGERVAVTGDGVNDAPALKKADIGIAMGLSGTDVARESADMILLDDNFATIVSTVEEGRAVYENIRKFISYIFASNVPEIIPYIAYVLFRIPLPLTIMQILAVDLGTDMFPALALGAESPSKAVMKQPPRSPDERLLNVRILSRAYLFLGPIEALAGLFGFFYVLGSGQWEWGEALAPGSPLYLQATSACLAGIIMTQIGNVFACRSFRESIFSLGFLSNRLLLIGIAIELIISAFIFYSPFGNEVVGTSPLSYTIWTILLPFSIALLGAEELRKYYVRRFSKA